MNNSTLLKAIMVLPFATNYGRVQHCRAINITMSTRECIKHIPDFEHKPILYILHDMHNNKLYIIGIIYCYSSK